MNILTETKLVLPIMTTILALLGAAARSEPADSLATTSGNWASGEARSPW